LRREPFGLGDLISEFGVTRIIPLLSTFKCTANPDAETFLKNQSISHDKDSISRTYLLLESDSKKVTVKGYFTLAVKCLAVDEECVISNKLRKLMNVNKGVAQAYLLGQLAKADGTEKGFGRMMISRALGTFEDGKDMFGCRVVRLDCEDEPKLVDYYQSCGFRTIRKDRKRGLNQMVMII